MAESGGPLVSVILIFWNEERHLAEAIESVLNQTWTNWELLLVNDGSTDTSGMIATNASVANPDRVRVLGREGGVNRGMSASRNLGISQASGEWISFIDGDDVWTETKLTTQLKLLATHPELDLLVSPALWWYDSHQGPQDFVQNLGCKPDSVVDGRVLMVGFLRNEWSSLCDVVARRSTVKEVGGYEDAFGAMFEDQVFHSKLLLGRPVLVTGQWWYQYRQHEATSTSRAHRAGEHRRARIRYLKWLRAYLTAELGIFDRLRAEVGLRLVAVRFPVLALARRAVNSTTRRLRAVRANRRQTVP